ncbi:MAG: hypothetical protein PHH06_03005 [Candidatus Gracilibacteria bacterium]|nr:hypothetical protein [Candidatus Gracilibacteria bacterium]
MEIILSKQALKKLSIISKSDQEHASLIKKKLILISKKEVELVQLKGYKGIYKERVGKYRIIFNYTKSHVNIIILERRDLVYNLVSHLL